MSQPQPELASAAKAASIHARLLNRAKQRDEDLNTLLARYGTERLLYRLSISTAREQFLLKGALLFDLWFNAPHRPTRDADFLGFGPKDASTLAATVQTICTIEVDDGMRFDSESVAVIEIREEANYGGLRAKLRGFLGRSICHVQLDVGYGDAVTPAPIETELPTLLEGMLAPRLRVYSRETVVAEKLEAIVSIGMGNSRMKDFYDLRALLREGRLDSEILGQAIAATFTRRSTPIPEDLPIGLTLEFADDLLKQRQWDGFITRSKLQAPPLAQVVAEVAGGFAGPLRRALQEVSNDQSMKRPPKRP